MKSERSVTKRTWNKKWYLCLFFVHDWHCDTFSMEAYSPVFWYCRRCGLMSYKEDERL